MRYDDEPVHDRRHRLKILLPANVHLMNKNESKMLRKLKMKTKMSEAEIRSVKKYRVMLSEAQDSGEKPLNFSQRYDKHMKLLKKSVSRETGLPPWHPDFQKKLKAKIHDTRNRYPYY